LRNVVKAYNTYNEKWKMEQAEQKKCRKIQGEMKAEIKTAVNEIKTKFAGQTTKKNISKFFIHFGYSSNFRRRRGHYRTLRMLRERIARAMGYIPLELY
jgi:hypothetical protein